ncbi:MFS transporter [Jannaschia sp. S6380]|uniref:MFS transporter n=1 Tax=Jannaschia sp. S6380 TaxID=2926408 RepID=UPI001FF67C9C|nr:MFS transporter [Jannaschia sp. S6380]MCK0167256.1 MFS transporter [Jannaschia sp. S6380]
MSIGPDTPDMRLWTLLPAGTMTIMAGATISPSLPAVEREIAAGPNGPLLARLVLTTPALFTAPTAALAGAAVDRFGRRKLLLVAIALYLVAGPAGWLVSSIWALLASRALLGVAVGIVMTASITLITDYYDGARRDEVLGRQAAFSGLGGIVFLLAGGLLADVSWRGPFAIYALVLPILILAWLHLPEPERRAPQADDPNPVPLARGRVAGLAGLAFASMVIFYLVPVQIPFHLAEMGTSSGTLSGVAVAATKATGAAASAIYGRVARRLPRRIVFAATFGLMAAGYGIVAIAPTPLTVVAGLALFGCGFGLLLPGLNALAGDVATEATRGRVVGVMTTCLFMGQFASPLATQTLIASFGSNAAFAVGAGLLLALAAGFAARGPLAHAVP